MMILLPAFIKHDYFCIILPILDVDKNLILLVLIDPQIFFGDLEGRVIIDLHDHNEWNTLLPCVVAEGLAQ